MKLLRGLSRKVDRETIRPVEGRLETAEHVAIDEFGLLVNYTA
jgi:hypothetical protein